MNIVNSTYDLEVIVLKAGKEMQKDKAAKHNNAWQ